MKLSFYIDQKRCSQLANKYIEFQKELEKRERPAYFEQRIKEILFKEEQEAFSVEKDFLLYRNPNPIDLAFDKTKVIFNDREIIQEFGFDYYDILKFIERLRDSDRVIWYNIEEVANNHLEIEKVSKMVDFWSLTEGTNLKETPIISTKEGFFMVFNIDYLIQYNHLIVARKFYYKRIHGKIRQKMSHWFEYEIGNIFKSLFPERSVSNAWVKDGFNNTLEEIDVLAWDKNKKNIYVVECKTNFMKTGKELQANRRLIKKPTEQLNRKKEVVEFGVFKEGSISFKNGTKLEVEKDVKIHKMLVSLEEGWDNFYDNELIEENDIIAFSWATLKLFVNIFDGKEMFFNDFVSQLLKRTELEIEDFNDGEYFLSKYLYSLDISFNRTPNIILNEKNEKILRAKDVSGLFRKRNKELLNEFEKLEVHYKKNSEEYAVLFDELREKMKQKTPNKVLKNKTGFGQ